MQSNEESLNQQLLDSIQNRDVGSIELLLNRVVDVTATLRQGILYDIVCRDDVEIMQLFLEKGADVNRSVDHQGVTLLMLAIQEKSVKIHKTFGR